MNFIEEAPVSYVRMLSWIFQTKDNVDNKSDVPISENFSTDV